MREDTWEQGHDHNNNTAAVHLPSSDDANCHRSDAHLSRAAMPSISTRACGEQHTRKPRTMTFGVKTALWSVLATAPMVLAQNQNCVSLSGSTECPAFSAASISTTDETLRGYFPFLRSVTNTSTFDEQLRSYVSIGYAQQKYQELLGCDNVDLANTTNLYARFTKSVLCNAIVQNSVQPCGLSSANSRPICASACADNAESEALIVANNALCTNPGGNADRQIRADFTNCALPANSLSGTCIDGAANEPTNCGFGNSTIGLCQYCGSGGQNSTDTCCYNSRADERCADVVLPTITAFMTFSTASPTASSTAVPTSVASASATNTAPSGSSRRSGLSGGAIAGIVIGSIAAVMALAALLFLLVLCLRKRRPGSQGSVFNQPSPARKGQSMAYNPVAATNTTPEGYEVLPGGRIARMSALEAQAESPPRETRAGTALSGASGGAAYAAGRSRRHESSSDEYSPVSNNNGGILRPPPTARRNGSLSSSSALGFDDPQSPHSGSGGDMSSPQGVASQQSEQLPFFKDYYSSDEIHPGDKVATLWAYQPRAGDEFALERGDMLKVVGIWDDGWATGVLINENAEDWEVKKQAQRDSGVSHTSGSSPNASGEIKAFPLVCVCLPDHWRKTIEGDGSTETTSTGPHGGNT
ncbi:SH3-domain-containing protein [Glarea lozoyensis ATCC 20868]|uniref:SH3-domain-containing protein n=1 Tax=Glarea lozoyensis (strain ATCC 20868 / MF5171) TaxID=1116229 RepID=S3E1Z4_GLAL2|nr:SH3-domain-containing protein [Glarea lozoyensis ATCC 20868]EPE32508.1 SH3-domain-containing protein [Glarea lozoyensis ATCC 20868]